MVKAKARKREQNKGKELKTEVLSSFPWQRVKDSKSEGKRFLNVSDESERK